jgi:hypothetical protein
MLSVEETFPDGRRRELDVRAVPTDTAGPVRFAVGRWSRVPRPVVPALLPPVDDLVALAVAVEVMDR